MKKPVITYLNPKFIILKGSQYTQKNKTLIALEEG